jgi:hypothetical protein
MSLLPDFHTRVQKRLDKNLENLRSNLEACAPEKHDRFCGEIAGTKSALKILSEEFQRIGGEE